MTDWNGNGKWDPTDSFIDYQVFHEAHGGGEGDSGGSSSGCLFRALLWLALMILVILYLRG